MGRAHTSNRRDGNHNLIVQTIQAMGYDWIDCTCAGQLACDGIALKGSQAVFVEIKNGALPPSARKLTQGEQERKAMCERNHIPYLVIESVDSAVEQMGAKERAA